jgi:hypothetical protein
LVKVFLHIQKCGGTSVGNYIKSKYKEEEYLELYTRKIPRNLVIGKTEPRSRIKSYLESLDLEKIKIVFGHGVFNGMEEYFPNQKVEYHTLFRNPIDRIISLYNFRRMTVMGEREFPIIYDAEGNVQDIKGELKKEFFIDGKERSFLEWFVYFNDRKKDETTSQSYYDFLKWRNFEISDFNFIGNESHIKHLPVENQSIKYLQEDRILIKNLLEVHWPNDFDLYKKSFKFMMGPSYLLCQE